MSIGTTISCGPLNCAFYRMCPAKAVSRQRAEGIFGADASEAPTRAYGCHPALGTQRRVTAPTWQAKRKTAVMPNQLCSE